MQNRIYLRQNRSCSKSAAYYFSANIRVISLGAFSDPVRSRSLVCAARFVAQSGPQAKDHCPASCSSCVRHAAQLYLYMQARIGKGRGKRLIGPRDRQARFSRASLNCLIVNALRHARKIKKWKKTPDKVVMLWHTRTITRTINGACAIRIMRLP